MPDHRATAPSILCLTAVLAAGTGAWAAEPSGTVVAVVPATQASGGAGTRMLVRTGPVYMGDVITTSAGGEAQIQLADDTRLVVGPNSRMVVDAFVFDGRGKAKNVTLNAVRGAFRFITGSSRKSAYKIATPTATIGVRGTKFDFSVDRRGVLNFALFDGRARVCPHNGRCIVLSGACSVAVIPRNGAVRRLSAGGERTQLLKTAFPYVATQQRLRPAFRVDTSNCGVQRANILPGGRPTPTIFGRRSSIFTPPGTDPGLNVDPGGTTGSIRNRNGFADFSNPGLGAYHNNASGGGSQNPGGTGNSGGGGGNGGNGGGGGNNGGGGGGGGNNGGGGGNHGNGNANGHNG